ncbi:hypothetical protein J2T14_004595 [Paenibacillus harenae]|nr:hypothetical protein [Paenibacillus harenae]
MKRVAGKHPSGSFSLGGTMTDPPIIEFHEDEYLKSALDDETLRIVLLFYGQDVKDSLLYKDDAACSTSSIGLSKTGTSR